MSEPTGHGRIAVTLHLTPGAAAQVEDFRLSAGMPSTTEALEAMIALAALHNFPDRIARAIKAQEARGYRR
jgi:hypothetical protein